VSFGSKSRFDRYLGDANLENHDTGGFLTISAPPNGDFGGGNMAKLRTDSEAEKRPPTVYPGPQKFSQAAAPAGCDWPPQRPVCATSNAPNVLLALLAPVPRWQGSYHSKPPAPRCCGAAILRAAKPGSWWSTGHATPYGKRGRTACAPRRGSRRRGACRTGEVFMASTGDRRTPAGREIGGFWRGWWAKAGGQLARRRACIMTTGHLSRRPLRSHDRRRQGDDHRYRKGSA